MKMDLYQQVIHKSRYARWLESESRRENWDETVDRYINFFKERNNNNNREDIPWQELRNAIYNMEIMPSMRALMTAGKALERDNVAGYNCAYSAIDSTRVFDECMYILMNGVGFGFSVERQYINKLPEISEEFFESDTIIVVSDSKIGWATSLRELLSLLWNGRIPIWDLSKLRPAGSKLKTFGGRSSGPGPLDSLFKFLVQLFKNAKGRKLTSIECHDIICKICEVVVVGGVRRSASISLSNLSDDRMRTAKHGQWWVAHPQRSLANNSAVYSDFPEIGIFMQEWISLYDSKSGERGIVNRRSLKKQTERTERRDCSYEFGVNPCGEIILRSAEFCNLTEVVIKYNDRLDDLKRKVELATILGTIQATLTDFRYLRKVWRVNTEEEALLGVSLTGIMDNKLTSNANGEELLILKNIAYETNKKFSNLLNINQSVSIQTVKPSGTVSQLVDSSSGIHPRFAPYYIRRIRMDKADPLSKIMIESKILYEEDEINTSAYVFSFPRKSPKNSIFIKDLNAIEQLNHWLIYKNNWCEHNPSVTIYVREYEWMEVGAWVYKNFDEIGGLSFLPYTDHIYRQAPYEEISKVEFEKLEKEMPKSIKWHLLDELEKEDNTTATHEFACAGGSCEI